MKKIGNVLSLFDGMSGAQQALNRAGIEFENYYSCEIDKFCSQLVSIKFPNTIQLGDVTKVKGNDLPKIDLIVCGSPCQGFSFAGKQLNFNDPRSALFFEAVRILNECRAKNPNILFLFENVRMKLEFELVFTKYLGVEPTLLNSALVSAQNRNRLYWTNIAAVPHNLFGDLKTTIHPPKDKGIFLRDILEDEVDEKYYLSERLIKGFEAHKERHSDKGNGFGFTTRNKNKKALSISTLSGSRQTDNYIKIDKKGNIKENQDKASCFTGVGNSGGNHSDMDLILHSTQPRTSKLGTGGTGPLSRNDGKTYCVDTGVSMKVEKIDSFIRRLTPKEVCRLQTVDYNEIFLQDGKQILSDTQIYKMCGNGFTIDIISYILSHIQ